MPAVPSYPSPSSLTCSPYKRTMRPLLPPHPCCAFATEPFAALTAMATAEWNVSLIRRQGHYHE
jgi:hypothetical protein